MEVLRVIASALIGFVSGLLAPWVKWQGEKWRVRQANRREVVGTWRVAIESEEYDLGYYRSTFGGTAAYSSLRAYMSPDIVKKVEAQRTAYVGGGRG